MMHIKKIKAGALQLVTFITVVIALLLAGFILLMHTQKQFKVSSNLRIENIQQASTGILYALKHNIPLADTITVEFPNKANNTLQLKADFWGVYQKVYSHSKIKKNNFHKIALVGSQPTQEQNALFLKEYNKPLVLVGTTTIKGNAHITKQGVRAGNIAGQSYYGEQLIYGDVKTIEAFPRLDDQFLKYLKHLPEYYSTTGLQEIDINTIKTHTNSFINPPVLAISSTDIYLNDVELTGHIIIQSFSKIIVDRFSKLKDVILIAPIIEIKDEVKGQFQAFATETITVGKRSLLSYPSSLTLNLTNTTNDVNEIQPKMTIGELSTIKGNIILLGKKDAKNYNTQLSIAESSTIKGEVYCQQNIELKGKVYGSIYADTFISNTNGSKYQNHILNAEIRADALETQYAGLPFFNAKKNIAQWLY